MTRDRPASGGNDSTLDGKFAAQIGSVDQSDLELGGNQRFHHMLQPPHSVPAGTTREFFYLDNPNGNANDVIIEVQQALINNYSFTLDQNLSWIIDGDSGTTVSIPSANGDTFSGDPFTQETMSPPIGFQVKNDTETSQPLSGYMAVGFFFE